MNSDNFKFLSINTKEIWERKKLSKNNDLIISEEGLSLNLSDNPISKNYISKALDSEIYGLQWHKITLDSTSPENTLIDLEYRASNNPNTDTLTQSELSWKKIELDNPSDALLDSQGRFFQIKITLTSLDGKNSPVLRGIYLFYPRFSYLRYLPSLYQKDKASKEFLEKFLSIFETALYEIDRKIFTISRYFDPKATPENFLSWLGTWLGLSIDEELPKDKLRDLISISPILFKKRGTREGLESLLDFFLGKYDSSWITELNEINPDKWEGFTIEKQKKIIKSERKFIIFENFQTDCIQNKSTLAEYQKIYGNDRFSFCVMVKPYSITLKEYNLIKRIIELEKPAHTIGSVALLHPEFYLGRPILVGINSSLAKRDLLLDQSASDFSSIIGFEQTNSEENFGERSNKV